MHVFTSQILYVTNWLVSRKATEIHLPSGLSEERDARLKCDKVGIGNGSSLIDSKSCLLHELDWRAADALEVAKATPYFRDVKTNNDYMNYIAQRRF